MIRLALILLLLATSAGAAELKVATWNLNWLTLRAVGDPILPENVVPRSRGDRVALRRYAEILDADIVAIQEIDGPEAASEIFPPDRYALYLSDDRIVQRVGFAVRRGLAVERNPDVVGLDVYPEAKFRLRSGVDITVILPGGRLRLLGLHLKSGCHDDRLAGHRQACETLNRQVPALQGWIVQRRAEGVPFVLIGDFNRVMDGNDELLAALAKSGPLTRAAEGQSSPCWGGNTFIDHIIAGGAARGWMQPGSMKVLVYRETDPAQKDHLSDHCPISVRFRVPD